MEDDVFPDNRWGATTRGFDHYFGTDVPNWPPYCFIENDRTIGIPTEFLPKRLLGNNQASVAGPALKDWTLEPILPALRDRAIQFITASARDHKPFFLYMPLTTPHTPLAVNENWRGVSGLNAYADLVLETDAAVGAVIAAIDAAGQRERTLIIFTSDNGCAPYIDVAHLEQAGIIPAVLFEATSPMPGKEATAFRSWSAGRASWQRAPCAVNWFIMQMSWQRWRESWKSRCRRMWGRTVSACCRSCAGVPSPCAAMQSAIHPTASRASSWRVEADLREGVGRLGEGGG